jgi:hypothetical protein
MLVKHDENDERRGSEPLLFLYLPNPTNERNVVGYILVLVAVLSVNLSLFGDTII